jgi:hypothetical protein
MKVVRVKAIKKPKAVGKEILSETKLEQGGCGVAF